MISPTGIVNLIRLERTMDGTLGVVTVGGAICCYTLERPWAENIRNISCIPCGHYPLERRDHWNRRHKLGHTYEVCQVPRRTVIYLHPGNTMDDSEGCILPGLTIGSLHGRRAVLKSTDAFYRLRRHLDQIPAPQLHIIGLVMDHQG